MDRARAVYAGGADYGPCGGLSSRDELRSWKRWKTRLEIETASGELVPYQTRIRYPEGGDESIESRQLGL